MVDVATISGAVSSLQTAAQIAKSLIGLRDTAMIQGKVIELQSAILAAQSSALTAQSEQSTLIERIRELEKKIADLEAWETEKERYALREISPGAIAYLVKASAQGSEPVHAICTNCYQHGRKSILQWFVGGFGTDATFDCPSCKVRVEATTGQAGRNFRLVAA